MGYSGQVPDPAEMRVTINGRHDDTFESSTTLAIITLHILLQVKKLGIKFLIQFLSCKMRELRLSDISLSTLTSIYLLFIDIHCLSIKNFTALEPNYIVSTKKGPCT